MKRFIDILLSATGILILMPVLIIVGVLIKITSPGSVFFRQKRIGKNKTLFTMYKFRTMRTDAPSDTPTHLLNNPMDFITPIGAFLRKTSLDELPQIWNILRGDMSIVGPRPALWNQTDLIAERDKYGANSIRPGLTGLAQINGRDELPIPLKASYDGRYKASFACDCLIIWRTVFIALKGKGVVEGAAEDNSREPAALTADKGSVRHK